ncbi:MAG: phage tail protein [Hafnia sp.]
MAINNFKPFATAANANVTTQADWETLPALLSGFTAGKASSAQVNKAIRQASFIAAALAQYTANKSELDVLDDGDINGFINKFVSGLGNDFQPLNSVLTSLSELQGSHNKFPYFNTPYSLTLGDITDLGKGIISKDTADDVIKYLGIDVLLNGKQPKDDTLSALSALTGDNDKIPYFNGPDQMTLASFTSVGRSVVGQASISDLLSYLGLGTAAKKDVGTGTGQIPDMSSWTSGNGWRKTPDGTIEQWGTTIGDSEGNVTVFYPIAFSSRPNYVGFCNLQNGVPGAVQNVVINNNNFDYAGFSCRNLAFNGTVFSGSASSFMWFARGQ